MHLSFIPFRFPNIKSVCCAFQTRCAGFSADDFASGNLSQTVGDNPEHVLKNRQALLSDLELDGFCELIQVHGDRVVFEPDIVAPEKTPNIEADGMATSAVKRGLCIKTADCQPILIAHKSGKYIAAIHAGWRGNRCDFPVTAVSRFCEHYSINPEDLLAVRGPSLGPGAAEFTAFEAEWGSSYKLWYNEYSKTMDLWALTRFQLNKAGIPNSSIFGIDLCTKTMEDLFYSYRRNRKCGRQVSVIWISEA